jgi:hypothetical protein
MKKYAMACEGMGKEALEANFRSYTNILVSGLRKII